jgi:hypothetical protein
MPRDMDVLTLRSHKCTITKDELEYELADEEDRVTRSIQVDTLDMTWFYANFANFESFTKML